MAGGPGRGEVWLVDLDPAVGREQAGERPVVVVSADRFNRGPAGLVIVAPMTTRDRRLPLHVAVDPPEGGVRRRSFVKCEDVRSISKDRLSGTRWGALSARTMAKIEDLLRILLDLSTLRRRQPQQLRPLQGRDQFRVFRPLAGPAQRPVGRPSSSGRRIPLGVCLSRATCGSSARSCRALRPPPGPSWPGTFRSPSRPLSLPFRSRFLTSGPDHTRAGTGRA